MTTSVRLYSKGRITGFKRAKRNQRTHTALMNIEQVKTTEDASFYLGKRVAYVYKALKEKNGSKYRVIWGRISRPHGSNGAVRAKFVKNLPSKCFGSTVRVVRPVNWENDVCVDVVSVQGLECVNGSFYVLFMRFPFELRRVCFQWRCRLLLRRLFVCRDRRRVPSAYLTLLRSQSRAFSCALWTTDGWRVHRH